MRTQDAQLKSRDASAGILPHPSLGNRAGTPTATDGRAACAARFVGMSLLDRNSPALRLSYLKQRQAGSGAPDNLPNRKHLRPIEGFHQRSPQPRWHLAWRAAQITIVVARG